MKRKIFLIFLALSFIGMMGWLISKEMTPPEVYEIVKPEKRTIQKKTVANGSVCLLYTSDAADERSSVDLGGRRIIKKKNTEKIHSSTREYNKTN